MKKFKKIISSAIVTAILLSTLSMTSYASKASDFVVENGVLTEYIGKEENVIIPDNLGITKIGFAAFQHKNTMKFVKVPEGVTELGMSAFQNNNNLTSVELPSTLKLIDGSAFKFCNNLVSIELPQNVTYIGPGAFEGCTSLSSLAVPDGVTEILFGTFGDCPNLTYLLIPSSVFYIDKDVFEYCSKEDSSRYEDNTNPTVYVEKDSFAENAMKQLNKTYVALDTIEKSSKDRIPVTLKETTVLINNKPEKFTTFNINGNNYFDMYEFKDSLKKINLHYYVNNSRSGPIEHTLSFITDNSQEYLSYGIDYNMHNAKIALKSGTTVKAMPDTFSWYSLKKNAESGIVYSDLTNKTGYIISNGVFMKIRDMADNLGFSVSWNNQTQMISINTSMVK